MVISFYASVVRSPPPARKFSTGNGAAPTGNLQANSNLSPPARNRSRSPATPHKLNANNISPEPSQVSFEPRRKS